MSQAQKGREDRTGGGHCMGKGLQLELRKGEWALG